MLQIHSTRQYLEEGRMLRDLYMNGNTPCQSTHKKRMVICMRDLAQDLRFVTQFDRAIVHLRKFCTQMTSVEHSKGMLLKGSSD